uniref:chromosome partitioning protein ParA n=1 Tax=Agathobacter sp. TaxID=2021311 RepID=UPI004056C087
MKIKLAVLEKDTSYLNRFITIFSTKYAEKIEVYSFTEKEVALMTLESKRIDVFIASDNYEIDVSKLPKRCSFAYFTDSPNVETIDEQQAICKFQKIDLIYKQILNLYSENAGNISGLKMNHGSCKVAVFTSPAGGVGSSTMAAACALHFAMQGKRTLYLNLEKYGYADEFFEGEGQFGMSDIIFALKSKKTNLSMKLESCVKQSTNGVSFYSKSQNALDMLELRGEEIVRMLTQLNILGMYDHIVLDIDFSLDRDTLEVCRQAHEIVWVSDGSPVSNNKLCRAYQALFTMEMHAEDSLMRRTGVMYNRFHSSKGKIIQDLDIRTIGGMPCMQYDTVNQILGEMAGMDIFDKLFQ